MGVKGGKEGFLIECTGPNCAARNHGRRRKLGEVRLDSDGWAYWHLPDYEGFRVVAESKEEDWVDIKAYRGREAVEVDMTEDDAEEALDFRVTCDRCGQVWVFTAAELTAWHQKGRPVALAREDVGRPVGG